MPAGCRGADGTTSNSVACSCCWFADLYQRYSSDASAIQWMKRRKRARSVPILSISTELRVRRQALGLSQAALARALGVASNTVARWERGERSIRSPELVDLALQRLAGKPDAAATKEPAHNLPAELNSFVGREDELATLRDLLLRERLLTLVGVGGVGKTRLALRLAIETIANYPDGVWLVELAPLADPSLLAKAVASALGILERPKRPLQTVLLEVLNTRRMLLVLDNCEHLVGACAELANALLRACPHLRILATSREQLGVQGEVGWSVSPLSLPSAEDRSSTEELFGSEAVRLWMERARTHQPAVALSKSDLRLVGEACRRLDGLPLAIELAAARLNVLAPEEIVIRLEDRYRLLTGGSRTGTARHQTLEAAIAWSYDLLSPPVQTVFRRLAVFAGGWTLDAAESICTGGSIRAEDVLDLLTHLVGKSLVVVDALTSGQRRYRQLETIRQYAVHKLQTSGDEAALRTRHADWFLDLAGRAERAGRGPNETFWLDRLEGEIDNLRGALSWSAEDGRLEPALRLAGALNQFWLIRGFWDEGRTTLERLLASAGPELPPLVRAKALGTAGILAAWQGDDAAARGVLHQSLQLYQVERNAGVATAWLDLGIAAQIHGDQDSAAMAFGEALALGRTLRDDRVVYSALYNLGEVARHRAKYEQARALLEESMRISAGYGDQRARAYALASLGRMAWMRGDYKQAVALQRDSLRLRREHRDKGGIAMSLEGLAWVASAVGHARRAARLLGAVERLRERCGYPLPVNWRNDHQRSVRAVSSRLGPAAFRAAWAAGRAISVDETMAELLDGDESSSSHHMERAAAAGAWGPLSRREREVAALVAEGCTNRQIGLQLVISEATAAKHIEHILDKLGLSSRAQVAVWAAQRGVLASAPS
jgi:predicted ATPase/DNA-binding CsgD family transcriptional regulator/DNA-binding transcriptional regulator YiaG